MTAIFVLKETLDDEQRVAATPETVQAFTKAGLEVAIERGAGEGASIEDGVYRDAGATLVDDARGRLGAFDAVVSVNEPRADVVASFREGALLVCLFPPSTNFEVVRALCERRVTCASLVLLPRITRAQSMDALSSQANLAGYKAALLAAAALPKCFPLMMTAAGTVKPATVVVLGAGVAGLQAIATARRLGAHVQASDVRLAAKEQVESLGARFIDVPGMEDLQDERGYAKAATPEFLERQRQIVGEAIADADAVITTAQVPGRPAPILIPAALVERMRAGFGHRGLGGGPGWQLRAHRGWPNRAPRRRKDFGSPEHRVDGGETCERALRAQHSCVSQADAWRLGGAADRTPRTRSSVHHSSPMRGRSPIVRRRAR